MSGAEHALAHLSALLSLDGEAGRGPREKSCYANGITGLFAPPIVAGVDAGDGLRHHLEELPLAFPRALLEMVLFLDGCPICRVGEDGDLFAQLVCRLLGV